MTESPWLLLYGGISIGLVMGYSARREGFCTLSSLERWWYSGDLVRFRAWILAIAVAIASTQLLQYSGIIELNTSFYLQPRWSLLGSILGGLMFGLGMALVGTCGFGALIRLGGGSLQSLVVVSAIGLAALSTQRGLTGIARQSLIEPLAIDLQWAGSQSIVDLLRSLTGFSLDLPLIMSLCGALFFWVFKDQAFRRAPGQIRVGTIIGLCVTSSWWVTYTLKERSFEPVQLEAASFVLPPGETINHIIAYTGSIPDFGVGLCLGVVLGSAICAFRKREVRWEACDDARELGRHLGGALLMGTGGVMAAGCTVGQGISAASTLAVSAPVALLSILIGARVGLAWLINGTAGLFRYN